MDMDFTHVSNANEPTSFSFEIPAGATVRDVRRLAAQHFMEPENNLLYLIFAGRRLEDDAAFPADATYAVAKFVRGAAANGAVNAAAAVNGAAAANGAANGAVGPNPRRRRSSRKHGGARKSRKATRKGRKGSRKGRKGRKATRKH